MPVLYVRVSQQVDTYVRECSARSGMSLAKTIELLLDEARRRGWQITRVFEIPSGEISDAP